MASGAGNPLRMMDIMLEQIDGLAAYCLMARETFVLGDTFAQRAKRKRR